MKAFHLSVDVDVPIDKQVYATTDIKRYPHAYDSRSRRPGIGNCVYVLI